VRRAVRKLVAEGLVHEWSMEGDYLNNYISLEEGV
jgi:hypothetical protein